MKYFSHEGVSIKAVLSGRLPLLGSMDRFDTYNRSAGRSQCGSLRIDGKKIRWQAEENPWRELCEAKTAMTKYINTGRQ